MTMDSNSKTEWLKEIEMVRESDPNTVKMLFGIISNAESLAKIPQKFRQRFVEEIISHHGWQDTKWTEAAIDAGIPKREVCAMVANRIRNLPGLYMEQNFPNLVEVEMFLNYGGAESQYDIDHAFSESSSSLWRLFVKKDGQLDEDGFAWVVLACARYLPSRVLESWGKISAVFSEEALRRVRRSVLSQVWSISDLTYRASLQVPIRDLVSKFLYAGDKEVLIRPEEASKILVSTMLRINDPEKVTELWGSTASWRDKVGARNFAEWTFPIATGWHRHDGERADLVERMVHEWVNAS